MRKVGLSNIRSEIAWELMDRATDPKGRVMYPHMYIENIRDGMELMYDFAGTRELIIRICQDYRLTVEETDFVLSQILVK